MYQEEYKRWLAADLEDADSTPELSRIEGDDGEIKERFAVALKFGTAGLRGVAERLPIGREYLCGSSRQHARDWPTG